MKPALSPENEALGWSSNEESEKAARFYEKQRNRFRPGPDAKKDKLTVMWLGSDGPANGDLTQRFRPFSPVINEPAAIEIALSMIAYKFARENGYTAQEGLNFTIYWYTTADPIDTETDFPVFVQTATYKTTPN